MRNNQVDYVETVLNCNMQIYKIQIIAMFEIIILKKLLLLHIEFYISSGKYLME